MGTSQGQHTLAVLEVKHRGVRLGNLSKTAINKSFCFKLAFFFCHIHQNP